MLSGRRAGGMMMMMIYTLLQYEKVQNLFLEI
jgi:hypothetical protein